MIIKAALSALLLLLSLNLKAQEGYNSFFESTDDPSPNNSFELFELKIHQKNHHFTIRLPDDGVLNIDFMRISDWGGQEELSQVVNAAARQVRQLKDSFKNEFSGKYMAINIPMDNSIISLKYKEDNSQVSQLAYKDGTYYQLKTGFDTVKIIKNVRVRATPAFDSGLVQVSYTFALKDIFDIDRLANQPAILEKIGGRVEKKVAEVTQKWHNPDFRSHTLTLDYDVNTDKEPQIDKYQDYIYPVFRNTIALYVGIGAVVFNNKIAPVTDLTVGYIFPSHKKRKGFAGLNISSFPVFDRDFQYQKTYTAINAEFGSFKGGTGLMHEKTSIGFGVMYSNYGNSFNAQKEKAMVNMIINWGVSNNITVGLNAASSFSSKNGGYGIMGVQFKFNL